MPAGRLGKAEECSRGASRTRARSRGGRENERLMVSGQNVGRVHPATRSVLSVLLSPPGVPGPWVPSHLKSRKTQAPGRPLGPQGQAGRGSVVGPLPRRRGDGRMVHGRTGPHGVHSRPAPVLS